MTITKEELKARARRHAAAQWERKKNDPAWIEKRRIASREWRKRNKERHAEANRRWREANPEKLAQLRARRVADPVNRAARNQRTRFKQILRLAIQGKPLRGHAFSQIIGCTPRQMAAHISTLFVPGMSWSNYGQWHIDHIKPCAAFDLRDPAQRRACFHFTNLQPLWAKDNISKGACWQPSPHPVAAQCPPATPPWVAHSISPCAIASSDASMKQGEGQAA